jgi:hypothetical protein
MPGNVQFNGQQTATNTSPAHQCGSQIGERLIDSALVVTSQT